MCVVLQKQLPSVYVCTIGFVVSNEVDYDF